MSFGIPLAATALTSTSAGTLANLSLAATLIGGGLGAFGAYQQGQAEKSSANYQAKLAERNAEIEKIRQQQSSDAADAERVQLARRAAEARGRGRTAFAANGVDLGGGGAPAYWEVALDAQQQYESNLITNNEQSRLFDSRVRQSSERANASALRASGSNAFTSGLLSAGGSVLATAGTVSDRFIRYKREGIYG